MNVYRIIKQETEGFAGKTAVVDGDCELSYGQLISSADGIAASLHENGVRPFHRVGILLEDGIDYITISLAVLSLSAVVVPVSQEQSPDEIKTILDRIAVDILIFAEGLYGLDDARSLQSKGFQKAGYYFQKRDVKEIPCKEYYEINPAFIRFSSGTTGASKGVVLSHEGIIERTGAADKGLRITSADTILWVLSMSFHFVVSILLFLRRAATIVLCSHRFPESLIEAITKQKGTFIYASPFHYSVLTHSELLSAESLNNVRLAVSTAIKLTDTIAEGFFAKFGFELTEAYGIIEVGLPFINLSADKSKRGAVGRALPDYEVAISDKDKEGVGEIYIKGKGLLEAYFSPWQNRQSILEDGWFKTGDFGKVDEDGFLTIVGRRKNVINFLGMKIFPDEVEAVINQHPVVAESVVYGAAHPVYGRLPLAKIVLKEGTTGEFDPEDLMRFCYQRLAKYKVPKEFECTDRIPKTPSGKIKR
ncbi:MAG: class I adenylate-forming enzyme family protein [Thermodesulfovibrionales bacterium]|jgi:long-chain acyl-CoA synthetase